MDLYFFTFYGHTAHWFGEEEQRPHKGLAYMIKWVLLGDLNEDITRFSQTFLNDLEEILLFFFQIKEWTIFLQPHSAPCTDIANGDGFGGMEDDRHVLIKFWKVVHRLCIELFLIEEK